VALRPAISPTVMAAASGGLRHSPGLAELARYVGKQSKLALLAAVGASLAFVGTILGWAAS
jgi:hypothetical protein